MAEARLHQVLQATLDASKDVRQAGEAELRALAKQPAALALQRYVGSHWSEASEKFEEPLVPQELRPRIREASFGGLGNPASGIRAACAYTVATIAKYDWPDFWPTLMDDLIGLLKHGSEGQLEGAMDVVTELVREDLGQDQLPAIASNLLPALLDILRNTEMGWLMRSKTLANFEEIISMFTTVREEYPQAVKDALDHFAPTWLSEMEKIISEDVVSTLTRDPGLLGLRNASFRVFSALNRDFAKFFAPYRIHMIQLAVQNLVGLVVPYQQYCVQSSNRPTLPDNYDETLIFDSLIVDIYDFVSRATRHQSVKPLLVVANDDQEVGTDFLRQLLDAVAALSQMSVVALEDLDDEYNINQFLAEEDDDSGVVTPRTAGHDLVASIIDQYPRAVASLLQDILVGKVQTTLMARQTAHEDWWQPLESMLAMLIALSDDLQDIVENDTSAGRPPTIALGQLYTEVVANLLQHQGSQDAEVLEARALLFAAAHAAVLPKEAVNSAFSIAISSLEQPDGTQVSKMSATKAIRNFCRHVNADVIRPRSQHIMALLLPNLRNISGEMLYLVLETLRAVLALDKNALNPQSTRELAEMVFATWLQNSTDPVATAVVEELLEVVASSSTTPVVHTLVVTLCPRLAATIAAPVSSENEHLPAEAVQLANSLIRTRGGPLEVELISTVTAAVMHSLQQTEDMHVVQHGMFHLTQVVRKDCDKLLQWRSGEGVSGMDTVLQLLSKFLNPQFPESGGIFVGDLIIHLLRKASSAIGPILPDLLQALVSRLAQAKLPSFIQALVLPFAYLCSTEHTQATLDLLASLPNPAPQSASSALQLVLKTWCEITDDIAGSWNIRVSALGLTRLYTSPTPALREVAVRGDLIIDEANRNTIMTRSKAKANPAQYSVSPFPVKCLKLLLKELQSFKTSAAKGKKVSTNTLDIDEDDGDDEWDDDDDLAGPEGKGEFDFLSSWLDGDGGGDMDAQDDDEDLRSDPIAQIDMVDHLTNVLRHCYSTNENGMHEQINGLNEAEKGMLRGVLTM